MNACPDELRLAAYHDGELSLPDRTAVERHVAACPACAAVLAKLRRTSAWLAAQPTVGLSPIGLARLHRRVDAAMEQGLVRFGWELSGLAAAVLLAGSVWLTWAANATGSVATVATVPPWVGAQAAAAADPVAQASPTPAAVWYLADAADGTGPRE